MSKDNVEDLKKKNNVHFIFPMKRNDKRIKDLNLISYQGTFLDGDDIIEYSKNQNNEIYYYCFKNSTDAANERKGYLLSLQKTEIMEKEKSIIKMRNLELYVLNQIKI